jgi:hypothetical protein
LGCKNKQIWKPNKISQDQFLKISKALHAFMSIKQHQHQASARLLSQRTKCCIDRDNQTGRKAVQNTKNAKDIEPAFFVTDCILRSLQLTPNLTLT